MSPCILIVDDNELNIRLLVRILEMEGYTVITSRNGKEAIRAVLKRMPDIVILDLMMPDMNGYELCRSLRQSPCNAKIPIVMLTALCTESERKAALKAGANDIWPKPLEMDGLRSQIDTLLGVSE